MRFRDASAQLFAFTFLAFSLICSLGGCDKAVDQATETAGTELPHTQANRQLKPHQQRNAYQYMFADEILLIEWEPTDDQVLGRKPINRADLPVRWQGYSDKELLQIGFELEMKGKEYMLAGQLTNQLELSRRQFCLYTLAGSEKRMSVFFGICGNLRDLGRADEALGFIKELEAHLTPDEFASNSYMFSRLR